MVDYMNLTASEEQVRQDGFSRERELADGVQALEDELVETLEELAEYRLAVDTPSPTQCKLAICAGLALTVIGAVETGVVGPSLSSCVLAAVGLALSVRAGVLIDRKMEPDG